MNKRLFSRLKSLVNNEDYSKITTNLGLSSNSKYSMELLNSMLTIRAEINNVSCFIDIGAYKGEVSKVFSEMYQLQDIFCFEPNHSLFNEIKQNLKGQNYVLENLILSGSSGEVEYFMHEDPSMNSAVRANGKVLKEHFPYDNPALGSIESRKSTTLDGYFNDESMIKENAFLKIDTQGNELEVLMGGENTLKKVHSIMVEFMFLSPYDTRYSFEELISYLSNLGFECKGPVSVATRPSNQISAVDFLFVRS
jgi:FkbM family methyltransferase